MQALKGLVIGMGLLIVIGMGVLGFGLYKKATDPGFRFFKEASTPEVIAPTMPAAPVASAQPAAIPEAFGTKSVPLAPGETLEGVTPDGNRLILHLKGSDGADSLTIVDMNSGAVLGRLNLEPLK